MIFDASRHFQAPSPDTAFAINTEELLADCAQLRLHLPAHQDSLEELGSQLWLPDMTLACSRLGSVTALWVGGPLVPGKEGR